jgi:AAA domain
MSTISFRPAQRENVNLLIGVVGPSGSGKTFSALRLASGIASGKRFAVVDTERGRSKHYAEMFAFDVAELDPPYSPARYLEAIEAADAAGYPVIVVDSMSHSWAGEGGCMDMQEAEFARLGNRDSVKLLSWAKPKGEYKRMLYGLLKVKAHVILCFRAEPKVEVGKDKDGKTVIVAKQTMTSIDGWIPITEKTLPYELTCSALVLPDHPGVPKWIKLQEQHKPMFPAGAQLDENAGKRILEWAAGATRSTASATQTVSVDDYTLLINEADADALRGLWTDIDAACKKAGDVAARAKLLAVKDARKTALGLA